MPTAECQRPVSTLRVTSGDALPEGNDVLEFRLLYQGQLLTASRGSPRAEHKHLLRKEFHKQLKLLWSAKSPLKERLKLQYPRVPLNRVNFATPEEGWITYDRVVAAKFSYHDYSFLPVVTDDLFLTCGIEILILRPEEPSVLLEGGDIDNRIKTIFDSLRMPTVEEAANLKNRFPPSEDEKPMYCLMQDDKLISEVKVTADYLLLLPGAREVKANDVFLVIHVRVKPRKLVAGNLDFA